MKFQNLLIKILTLEDYFFADGLIKFFIFNNESSFKDDSENIHKYFLQCSGADSFWQEQIIKKISAKKKQISKKILDNFYLIALEWL